MWGSEPLKFFVNSVEPVDGAVEPATWCTVAMHELSGELPCIDTCPFAVNTREQTSGALKATCSGRREAFPAICRRHWNKNLSG